MTLLTSKIQKKFQKTTSIKVKKEASAVGFNSSINQLVMVIHKPIADSKF